MHTQSHFKDSNHSEIGWNQTLMLYLSELHFEALVRFSHIGLQIGFLKTFSQERSESDSLENPPENSFYDTVASSVTSSWQQFSQFVKNDWWVFPTQCEHYLSATQKQLTQSEPSVSMLVFACLVLFSCPSNNFLVI